MNVFDLALNSSTITREDNAGRPHWVGQLLCAIGFAAVVVALAKWGTPLPGWADVIASENGPVERMSAAVWFMGFAWSLHAACCQKARAVEWLGLATFLLLFGLRELDAHVWATGWNLDKLANFWNPQYALRERILVIGLMIVPCTIVGGMLVYKLWKTLERGGTQNLSWLPSLVAGMVLLGVCLALDKIGAYLLPHLIPDKIAQIVLMMSEEFLELVLAVFSVIALWPYWRAAIIDHD